ncbi:hypothetical protein HHX47_DHR4000273 [Lentinula edodes]|nr:hypothetical protein HHX47_DHR4000273 [Lentinula edodes]
MGSRSSLDFPQQSWSLFTNRIRTSRRSPYPANTFTFFFLNFLIRTRKMVHSHTVLTAVIAVGVATSALAAPINPVPSRPTTVTTVTGAHPQNVPTRPHTISRQVTSDPQLPPVVPGKSLNAREFDVIVEEDSHPHHPHPHHHHEGFEVEVEEHHGEEFKLDFEEEHRYPHHPHHYHHHGGEDFEVDVEFDEHHPHHPHPHHHHGEDFEVDVELEEHRPHRHHGEETFEIEVEEHHHHHHHHHHHGGEHFEHKHHAHHAHHHEVEVVPIPIPVPVEHKDFKHPMGRPPKVVKDEVWVVATEGNPVGIDRRQDEGGLPPPAPVSGSDASSSAHRALMQQIQNFRQTPQGQKFSSNLREGVTKRSPVKSADTPNNAATGDPSQLSRRQDLSKLPMSFYSGPSKKKPSAQSLEWTRIQIANPGWQKDMDESGGDWEKFLQTKTGKDVAAENYPALVTFVKQALKQHTNPNNPRSHQSSSEGTTPTSAAGASATSAPGSGASSSSSTLNRRSGSSASGSSSSSIAGSSPNESPMGSPTSSTGPGFGATGSGATSSTGTTSSGTSDALGSTSGSAASASPSGAATTTSAGYSSAHKQLKEQHREEWKKFKEANPTIKEDLKSAKGNVQAFLQTPSGQALAKENKAFQKFVETHVVEHHKKHGQNHHHQSASSQQPASPDGSSSASSSPSSPASANGANSAPVGRSVLAARMGFGGGHGWSPSALPGNPHHGGHRHHIRSVPGEAGDASGTPSQTSALPIQSSSSTPNGPGMGAVNGAPSPFSGTPSSGALSGPSTFGLPPSAPPNGNGQGGLPQSHRHGGFQSFDQSGVPRPSIDVLHHLGGIRLEHLTPPGTNLFGSSPRPPPHDNTGSVPGTPPNPASGASSPPPSGATSQGMPGAPTRRALQRVRRSTPYGDFGADLD